MNAHCRACRRPKTPLERRVADERGAVLVEFVLILPVFLLLLFGGIDVSIAVNSSGSFSSGVSQGTNLIATGDSVTSGPCIATIQSENTNPDYKATLGTAEALCEVYNAIGPLSGVDLSQLQMALICESSLGVPADCNATGSGAPSSFVVCARAPAQSVTGLTSFILSHVTVSGAGYGPLTGTASTTWNGSATTPTNDPNGYNSTTGSTNPMPCPPPTATYTVTYSSTNSDGTQITGGTPPTDPNSPYGVGATVTVLDGTGLSYNGLTFAGWCTTNNNLMLPSGGTTCSTGTFYTTSAPNNTFRMPAADVTLYPVWQ